MIRNLTSRCQLPAGIAVLFCLTSTAVSADQTESLSAMRQFESHIRPVLIEKCLQCHGEQKQEGGLRLDSREAMLNGGDSGPAVVPGDGAQSLLMEALRYESFQMPPTGELDAAVVRQFEHWIQAGAVWPADQSPLRPGRAGISDEDRRWWAFQPVVRPNIPTEGSDGWSRNPIDGFVLALLRQQPLQPAPAADRLTLVRRLYLNLLGLPPTPDEITTFLNDDSTNAWEMLVDRLLDDPRYGEHWARSWLDLVRYAESDGWNRDSYRPDLWRYRDYVVGSLNSDKPYPKFVREQLAGDEIGAGNPEHLAAVGFLRLGIYEYNQRDARGQWNDIINEMTDVTADVFLGMGMSCARCHDHKFDPILQTDYFRLRAFFEPVIWRDDLSASTEAERAAHDRQLELWQQATATIREQIDEIVERYHERKWKSTVAKFPLDIQACFHKPEADRNSWEHQMAYLIGRQFEEEGGGPLNGMNKEHQARYEVLQKELATFDHLKPKPLPALMTVSDFPGAIAPTMIPDHPQTQEIAPGILTVLKVSDGEAEFQIPEMPQSTGRRTALAEWIGQADNPLTPRVYVNRIWQQHFGQGLVPTSSDFGHQGVPPTHPELLDWLTSVFVDSGWRMKPLHRLILTSATWQQSASHPNALQQQAADPTDSLLWRARIRRLKAEQIRDAMLLCSGELLPEVGGPSVEATIARRSLYVKSIRNTPDQFLYAFDVANGLQSISERGVTTTPIQSLLMINGAFVIGRAAAMAEHLRNQSYSTIEDLLLVAFQRTWGRQPQETEMISALSFLETDRDVPPERVDAQKLADFCHVLFNSNEFLYVD